MMTLISRFGALRIIANDSTVWQIEDRAEMLRMSNRTSTTLLVSTEVHINDYNAIKISFSTGAGISDNLRENLAEHADPDRTFEHAEQLEAPATTREWAKEASEAFLTLPCDMLKITNEHSSVPECMELWSGGWNHRGCHRDNCCRSKLLERLHYHSMGLRSCGYLV